MKEIKPTELKQTEAAAAGLKGKVKQVKQICYKARRTNYEVGKGKIEHSSGYGKDERNYSAFYNEAGHKTDEHIFGEWSQSHRTYNDRGLLIEDIHYYHDNDTMDARAK